MAHMPPLLEAHGLVKHLGGRRVVDGVDLVCHAGQGDELLERFALATYAADKPEALSGGYRRRLMIARALVHRPRLLFLDEPTTGLDPQARVAVWDLVNGLRAEGLGIVLTTHYMDEAERLSDALTVLAQGKVAAHGTPKSVLGDMLGE